MRVSGGRYELKHYINQVDFVQLCARLPHVAQPDAHAGDGAAYRVRSLYFDNYDDKALREKIDGVNRREKFRIRFYKDDPSFMVLEKKSKHSGLTFKQSEPISREVCAALLDGQYEPLKQDGRPLLMELYVKLHAQLLRPKNIVDYNRLAYVFPAGNVRITVDHDIRACTNVPSFLQPEMVSLPIPNTIILEVKYDHFLPELIRGLVSLSSRRQTAFSKYAVSRII